MVMMQKVASKAMNSSWGMWVPWRGAKPTPCRATMCRPPMKPPLPSKASEYPTSAHVTVAIPIAPTLIMKVLSVFLLRTRPA